MLFNASILKNIRMAKPDATEEEVIAALKATNAWEFVSKYADTIHTDVGASGSALSGGQK